MTATVRYLMIATFSMFLFASAPSFAKDDAANVAVAKACSKECADRHGNGMQKGEKYDAQGYESCMNECMQNAQPRHRSSGSSAGK